MANLVTVVSETPEEVVANRLITPVAVIGADSTLEYINPAGALAPRGGRGGTYQPLTGQMTPPR